MGNRPILRVFVVYVFFTVFIVGLSISILELKIVYSDFQLFPFLSLIFLLSPISLLYGGVNMVLTARTAGVQMKFSRALRVACVAQTAEILPLPGGAIVRGAAMINDGASKGLSAAVVIANSVMWLSCGAAAAGMSLASRGWIAWGLFSSGTVITCLTAAWIMRRAGVLIALASISLRILGLALAASRILMAFAAISLPTSLRDSLVFAFANIAGSASSLAPGGLGVSESLAALFANATATLPAAAFIGVGLNRVIGIFVAGVATAVISLKKSEIRADG